MIFIPNQGNDASELNMFDASELNMFDASELNMLVLHDPCECVIMIKKLWENANANFNMR